ncbi:pilus assembly protein TadG-related protein, partial [Acidocella sp.]|uniref:pilus assembly protein TadG-related protein n=1 Tax=Acidocella sp. TaxID=50710 RepID=UPI0026254F51
MFRSLVKFIRGSRAAVAMTMAIMAVPLIIATSAAVDMSRVIVARTVLQAAVDTAAASGAGAWGTS